MGQGVDGDAARRTGAPTVRRLPVGDGTTLEVVTVGGGRAGPVVALLGGVHGDEDEGVVSVRRVVAALPGADLAGAVRAVAVANPPAYAARTRCSPIDGLNLARVFPGHPTGTVTRRIAHAITHEVITGADLLIDLHSAGVDYTMPLFCGYHDIGTPASRTAAVAADHFGTDLLWAHTVVSEGRTLSAAAQLGVPAVYAEAAGGGQVRGAHTDAYVHGVLRVLRWLGVLRAGAGAGDGGDAGTGAAARARMVVRGGRAPEQGSIAARVGGTLVTRAGAAAVVAAGQVIAEVYDDRGRCIDAVTSDRPAIIMKLRRAARVAAGEEVAVLAPPPAPWPPPRAEAPATTRVGDGR